MANSTKWLLKIFYLLTTNQTSSHKLCLVMQPLVFCCCFCPKTTKIQGTTNSQTPTTKPKACVRKSSMYYQKRQDLFGFVKDSQLAQKAFVYEQFLMNNSKVQFMTVISTCNLVLFAPKPPFHRFLHCCTHNYFIETDGLYSCCTVHLFL